jgi:hypothetical protein
MEHLQVAAMHALQRAAGGAIAGAALAQAAQPVLLDIDGARSASPCSIVPDKAIRPPRGKGPSGGQPLDHRREQTDELAPGGRHRHAGLGHLRLDRIKPGRIGARIGSSRFRPRMAFS